MSQGQENSEWSLPSGIWYQEDKVGYVLKRKSDTNVTNRLDPDLMKQLLNLPSKGKEIYPPEFIYHPQTGEPLNRAPAHTDHYWLAPFGQSLDLIDVPKTAIQHGLQLSNQLRKLKNNPESVHERAEISINFKLKGAFEFLSIKIGTPYLQLIAFNKINGSLYLFNEVQQEWFELTPKAQRLMACPTALIQSWHAVSFLTENNQHEIYIPTVDGLACLKINGFELNYSVDYVYKKGLCLSQPVYWQKRLFVPMLIDQQVQIVDVFNEEAYAIADLSSELYFEKAVYDSSNLIWVGKPGQLIIQTNADLDISAKYLPWLPTLQPDFRFGAPYYDNSGNFHQLCRKGDGWYYVQLNTSRFTDIKSQYRFTTGHEKYSFEDKINGDIWNNSSNIVGNQKIVVPCIEDLNQQLILGFRFESDINYGIDEKLNNTNEQDIMLFLEGNDLAGLIHLVRVNNPLESRFFYHKNYLYFYNASLNEILGWEAQA